jgi:hypothetical protein
VLLILSAQSSFPGGKLTQIGCLEKVDKAAVHSQKHAQNSALHGTGTG